MSLAGENAKSRAPGGDAGGREPGLGASKESRLCNFGGLIQTASMVYRTTCLALIIFWSWGCAHSVQGEETNLVRFKVSAPYSSDDEIGRRFGFRPPFPDYDINQEKFRLRLPADYSTNRAWGLLVWLSPGDDGYLTPDWADELARQNIIVVAPLNAGSARHPIDRLRLALDAASNTCRRFRIERKRIYVGGFSEGARLASMIGIGCGDIFVGTLCVGGANFYLQVPAGGNLYYPSAFFPNAEILYAARRFDKYVLVTGEGDPNREIMRLVVENGFLRDGFKQVRFLDVPGLQQGMPGIGPLRQSLAFLDGKKDDSAATK